MEGLLKLARKDTKPGASLSDNSYNLSEKVGLTAALSPPDQSRVLITRPPRCFSCPVVYLYVCNSGINASYYPRTFSPGKRVLPNSYYFLWFCHCQRIVTTTFLSGFPCRLCDSSSNCRQVVSLWACSKMCAVFFVAGIVVGYTLKKRVRRWAAKLLRRLKDD
ncbi:hypothetical protein DKX38_009778 [Salix brachista]|uniref:Uncharacterized protein n=1 Tax=Salix brachista TaxID=2182728 RepID=A0A5N5MBM2_9ROSI|nr:hypothetical protein DKX38_009778 [Salix brachista]